MKILNCLTTASLFVATVVSAPALASENKPPRDPIRPTTQCLDMTRSAAVYAVDNQTVIAKTGPKYFRINLLHQCPKLTIGTVELRSAHHSRYLCGVLGDKVYNHAGVPCTIESMAIISEQQFEQLEAKAIAN